MAEVRKCAECGNEFEWLSGKHRPARKFCRRECYIEAMRCHDTTPYPKIWRNGKREYLHRVIWMDAHPDEVLTSNDVIHHKDENPFNRAVDNLEKLEGRAEHLRRHDYHRRTKTSKEEVDYEYGF